jgi:hypothetical protein
VFFYSDLLSVCGLSNSFARKQEALMTMIETLADEGAISIKRFCQRNNVGVTTAYKEIGTGRLVARKCGGRTLILLEDERKWRDSLPRFQGKSTT